MIDLNSFYVHKRVKLYSAKGSMESLAMFLTLVVLSICPAVQSRVAHEPHESRPLNIAHRGSSGKLPEHTLEAYRWGVSTSSSFKNVHTEDSVISEDIIHGGKTSFHTDRNFMVDYFRGVEW